MSNHNSQLFEDMLTQRYGVNNNVPVVESVKLNVNEICRISFKISDGISLLSMLFYSRILYHYY